MSRKSVKASLLMQLQAKGVDHEHFKSLIDDYMRMWDVKEKLSKDIRDRGVVYKDFSSVGIEMMKNNPSTKELLGVNRQMLSTLRELGLTTGDGGGGGGGEPL